MSLQLLGATSVPLLILETLSMNTTDLVFTAFYVLVPTHSITTLYQSSSFPLEEQKITE